MQWHNGQLWTSEEAGQGPFNSLGLRFGASVFTTMRVYGQCLTDPRSQFPAHCDRLARSIHAFDWQPPSWTSVHEGCDRLKSHYPVLRITLFPNGEEWITGRSLPPNLSQLQAEGVVGWVAPPSYARSLPIHKTGNYLACQLARQQAQKHGAAEAILTNPSGDWLETTTGNLWGWAHGQWWTPKDDALENQCLPGLMRTRLQQILKTDGQWVNGNPWYASVRSNFEIIAYSNCVMELVPIHTILDGQIKLEYDPLHPELRTLRKQLARKTQFCDDS